MRPENSALELKNLLNYTTEMPAENSGLMENQHDKLKGIDYSMHCQGVDCMLELNYRDYEKGSYNQMNEKVKCYER
ncbi:hypothetical protein [Paenibacillus sp. IHBB 3054]|uniref:hypothetical protein n=1 Tax=Paenibacillus sp. IHBB 3054 TaxID=3425689 RepID=UPI003F6722C8